MGQLSASKLLYRTYVVPFGRLFLHCYMAYLKTKDNLFDPFSKKHNQDNSESGHPCD